MAEETTTSSPSSDPAPASDPPASPDPAPAAPPADPAPADPPSKPRAPDGKFAKAAEQPPPWSEVAKGIADEKARGFAERFTSLEELAKGALGFRQAASQREGWVKLPGKDAPEEDVKAWRAATGVPDAPEAYGVTLPPAMLPDDESKNRFGDLLKVAHDSNVPRAGLSAIIDWYVSTEQSQAKQREQLFAAEMEKGDAELRRLWGADYDENMALAARAAGWAGAEEMAQLHEDIGIDKHYIERKAWAKVGKILAPHVAAIGFSSDAIVDNLEAIIAEGRRRQDDGTYADPDYQRRRTAAFNARYPGIQTAA